jgi:hypothetical protein
VPLVIFCAAAGIQALVTIETTAKDDTNMGKMKIKF